MDLPEGFTFPQLDFGFETNPEKLKVDNANESEGKALAISENPCSSVTDLQESSREAASNADKPIAFDDAENHNGKCEAAEDKSVITERKSSDDKGDLSSDSDSGIISNASDSSSETLDTAKHDSQTGNHNTRCSKNGEKTNATPSSSAGANKTDAKPESHDDACSKQQVLNPPESSALPGHTAPCQDMQSNPDLDATKVTTTCSENMCHSHQQQHSPHNSNNIQTDVSVVCPCVVNSCNSDVLVPSHDAAGTGKPVSECVTSERLQPEQTHEQSSSSLSSENQSAIISSVNLENEHSQIEEADTSSSVTGSHRSEDENRCNTEENQLEEKNVDASKLNTTDSGSNKSADDLTNCDKKPQVFQCNTRDQNQDTDFGLWGDAGVASKKTKKVEKADDEDVYTVPTILLDEDRDLSTFVGPTPCLLLQALTMSNANDFFSLERLETIGDSFLKYAITVYLYCTYPGIHEGKLSYLRSKQVSNYNLYRLGRKSRLAECMVSSKFEPYENWLPPCYVINEHKRRGPVPKVLIANSGCKTDRRLSNFVFEDACEQVTIDTKKNTDARTPGDDIRLSQSGKKTSNDVRSGQSGKQQNSNSSAEEEHSIEESLDEMIQRLKFEEEVEEIDKIQEEEKIDDLVDVAQCLIPYSLQTQHGIPDKSVADCVEALIGCYLTTCGKKAALLFMSWLGLKVLSKKAKADPVKKCDGQQV